MIGTRETRTKISCHSLKNHYLIKNLSKEGGNWPTELKPENKRSRESENKSRLKS
jgi:hypothetical protein